MVNSVSHDDVRELARILLELTETKTRLLSQGESWRPPAGASRLATATPEDLLWQVKTLSDLIKSVGNGSCPAGTHECGSGCCPDWFDQALCDRLGAIPGGQTF